MEHSCSLVRNSMKSCLCPRRLTLRLQALQSELHIQSVYIVLRSTLGLAPRFKGNGKKTGVNSQYHIICSQLTCCKRNRLWKSLRVLDLFLSTSMGRPPATSDVDCTVPYRTFDDSGEDSFDLLNASAQIFLITEGIVVEVYSRKKVSYQLTEGISRQLRDWSLRWLQRLKDVVSNSSTEEDPSKITGACQVLCSYYYGKFPSCCC